MGLQIPKERQSMQRHAYQSVLRGLYGTLSAQQPHSGTGVFPLCTDYRKCDDETITYAVSFKEILCF